MADFPALPLWTDAYIADTAHLTNEEHGVYLRLMMFAWRTPGCALPDDDKRLALMVGVTAKKWASLRPIMESFWHIANGTWTQKRLTAEREFVQGKSNAGRAGAEARWRDKSLKENKAQHATASRQHMPERCEVDAPTPIPIVREERGKPLSGAADDSFEEFWNTYPHRNGAKKGKQEALKVWQRHMKAGTEASGIIDGARRYAGDRQVLRGFAKDPSTWLNAKAWNDDIEGGGPHGNGNHQGDRLAQGRERARPALENILRLASSRSASGDAGGGAGGAGEKG